MDFIIAVLIAVLIVVAIYYFLYKDENKNKQTTNKKTELWGKRPAFTKEEWNEAVSDWYTVSFIHDTLAYPLALRFDPWKPPDYDEVKYDQSKLESLRVMTKFMRESIDR